MRHNGSGGHDPAEGMAHEDNELIQASLGDSGGRLLGPRLTQPQATSPAGGAGLLTSRCSDG